MIRSAEQALDAAAGCAASLTRCGVWPFGPDCGPELLPQLVASDLEKKGQQPTSQARAKLHMCNPLPWASPPLFFSLLLPLTVCVFG